MKIVEIPENLTGKEVTLIYDFLADVLDAIWVRHQDKMVEILIHEEDNLDDQMDWLKPEVSFDEIPF